MDSAATPSKSEQSVKFHERRYPGSKILTLICDLGAGALFSNCFWNKARLQFQESKQFVSEMWAGMLRSTLTIQG